MSYEGFTERLCEGGHLWCDDAYADQTPCPRCGKPSVWEHEVDCTNGEVFDDDGNIYQSTTNYPLEVVRYEKLIVKIPIYRIPEPKP